MALSDADVPIAEAEPAADEPVDLNFDRPVTRGDCLPGGWNEERPCPFVGCVHHLAAKVNDENDTGYVRLLANWDDGRPTCALDEVDKHGGQDLAAIGRLLGITRERARQIESKALLQLVRKCRAKGIEPTLRELPSSGLGWTWEAA